MIYSLIFTVSGALDGVTRVIQDIPAAEDGTGLMRFTVTGNLGGLAWEMLEPLVGIGGYLVCGVGVQLAAGAGYDVRVGIVGRTSASVIQMPPGFPAIGTFPTQPPYVERPFYVPPEYRLAFLAANEGGAGSVVRLDIAPLRTQGQATRALRAVRPNVMSVAAFP